MNFMKQKLSLSAAHTNSLSAKVLRLIENAQEKTRFAAHGKNFDLQILFAYNVSPYMTHSLKNPRLKSQILQPYS